jgi:hypothetical protein
MDEVNPLTQNETKLIRFEIQKLVDRLKAYDGGSRERSLSITKLQEGKMWLGMELGNLGGEDLNAKRDKKELQS